MNKKHLATIQNALLCLGLRYSEAYAFLDYASTESNPKTEKYYKRRALKIKTKAIVAHDREINNRIL